MSKPFSEMKPEIARAKMLSLLDGFVENLSTFRAGVVAANDPRNMRFLYCFASEADHTKETIGCDLAIAMSSLEVGDILSYIMSINPTIAYHSISTVFEDETMRGEILGIMQKVMLGAMNVDNRQGELDLATTTPEGTA